MALLKRFFNLTAAIGLSLIVLAGCGSYESPKAQAANNQDSKQEKQLTEIQKIFKGVKPVYVRTVGEKVPEASKKGLSVAMIRDVVDSVSPNGLMGVPDSESYFKSTEKQLERLKNGGWNNVQRDIRKKLDRLNEVTTFIENETFDQHVNGIKKDLRKASETKNYKTYAEAAKKIIDLSHSLQEVTQGHIKGSQRPF